MRKCCIILDTGASSYDSHSHSPLLRLSIIKAYKITEGQKRQIQGAQEGFIVEILMSMLCEISRRERNCFVITANFLVSTFWSIRSGDGLVCRRKR